MAAKTLYPAHATCVNCHGEGYVLATKHRAITHEPYTVRWTCRCRQFPPIGEPEPQAIGEIPAWMLGEDD